MDNQGLVKLATILPIIEMAGSGTSRKSQTSPIRFYTQWGILRRSAA